MSHVSVSGGRVLRSLALLLAPAIALPAMAGTILVPQQKPTIQAAINAAVAGDTVLVAPGVYSGPGNRDLDTMGKAITVKSAGGAGTCTIIAGGSSQEYHSGFTIQSNESSATVIEGFTITGGYMFNGGGVCVLSGSPTVRNCVMTGNYADCWGAGYYSQSQGVPRLLNCVLTGNTSGDEGGGVFVISSSVRVENCIISDNVAAAGAGVCSFGGSPVYINCQITGNTAEYYGGGIYLWGGQMINCTMSGNHADFNASAIYGGGAGQVTNSILWGNTGAPAIEGSVVVTYSIVEGGFAGAGNRMVNPMFVNAAAGYFQLSHRSPAIDAGSNAAVPTGVLKDLAGRARFIDHPHVLNSGEGAGAVVDMGAFEATIPGRTPGLRQR